MFQAWNYHSSAQRERQGSSAQKKLQRYHPRLCHVYIKFLRSFSREPVLDDVGIPQVTQTAYRKGVGYQDSTFAGKESTDSLIQGGDNVFTCFYDVASVFDTVKFSILLEELFRDGIQGKCWRLIHNWYLGLTSQVSLGKKLSRSFLYISWHLSGLCAIPNSLPLSAGSIALKPLHRQK